MVNIKKDYLVSSFARSSIDQGEFIILNMKTGKFFGLDSVGSDMWRLLELKFGTQKIIEQLKLEYDVPEETLNKDIMELFLKMEKEELIYRV
ncbi:PqqD family protein [Paenibacillus sp. MBLB4367]|uniref:PqqD family protein n=1 Tax=Paenibacillus sp. MBLB4367 TaxID=3384767 RepID=UPI0039083E86